MPTIQKVPYELLFRWNNGALAGAHIRFLERIVDADGVTVLAERECPPEPVAVAGRAGFPLLDALQAVQLGAVMAASVTEQRLAEAQAALAQASTDLQAMAADRAQLAQDRDDAVGVLTEQLAAAREARDQAQRDREALRDEFEALKATRE